MEIVKPLDENDIDATLLEKFSSLKDLSALYRVRLKL